jgi:hypothetical protein
MIGRRQPEQRPLILIGTERQENQMRHLHLVPLRQHGVEAYSRVHLPVDPDEQDRIAKLRDTFNEYTHDRSGSPGPSQRVVGEDLTIVYDILINPATSSIGKEQ